MKIIDKIFLVEMLEDYDVPHNERVYAKETRLCVWESKDLNLYVVLNDNIYSKTIETIPRNISKIIYEYEYVRRKK